MDGVRDAFETRLARPSGQVRAGLNGARRLVGALRRGHATHVELVMTPSPGGRQAAGSAHVADRLAAVLREHRERVASSRMVADALDELCRLGR